MFKWFRRDDGNATIEFVILFPMLISLFFSAFEVGIFLTRSVLLDRALDINMRLLRLGALVPPDGVTAQEELTRRICNDAMIIKDCPNAVTIELVRIPDDTWTFPSPSPICVDRNETIKPVVGFNPGGSASIMVVRVCAVVNPFFASTPLVMNMPVDDTGGYSIIAASTFVNE